MNRSVPPFDAASVLAGEKRAFIVAPLAAICLALPSLADGTASHTVTFRRMNGTILSRVEVAHGEPAPVPRAPDESGYTFKGWDNTNKISSVTQDISCWALYEKGGFPDSMTGIDSRPIAAREQPYTLDEYFQMFDHVAWGDEFGETSVKANFYGRRPQQRGVLSRTLDANRVVEDGLLKLRCKREDSGNYHFTSGEIITQGKVTFYKGRIEIRARLNYARGTWPSFWTMNAGWWSGYNEIDVFEQLSGSDWIGGCLHVGFNGATTSSNHTAPEDGVRFRDGFHRIGAIVTERELIWYVDDHIFKRMDITASPWNATPATAKYLLLCSGVCAGGWLASLGPELRCATAADIPDDFMVDDYEIDYMRIYTNTNANNAVAYDEPPAAARLSAPVRATVWRGYDMRYGKPQQDFTRNVNTGYDVGSYVNTALRQHFGRDKADVVAFLSPTDDPDTEQKSAFDIPGTSAVFVDSKYRYDNGHRNEEARNGFVFDSTRFDPAEAGAETFALSDDVNFTNCYAVCLDLKERATGARVKVVGVNVIATNGVENADGAVARGFDALFTKLNSMKDDNVILFIQGWDWNRWHYLCQRAATELDAKFMKIGERNGAWPNYQSAYATANVSATMAVPANLAIPYKNLSGSKSHRPGALQATVTFDKPPESVDGSAPLPSPHP